MGKNINDLFEEWIKRLELSAWRIKLVTNVHPSEMSGSGLMGCVEYCEVNRSARIEIMDEKYYGDRIMPFDEEYILVHELLHLKFCFLTSCVDGFDDQNVVDRMTHQLLDDMAKALVDAKRSERGEDDAELD